jgi:hypothetical protein
VTRTGQSANADVDNVVVCLDDGNGTWDGIGIDNVIGSTTTWQADNTALVGVTSQTVTNAAGTQYYYVLFRIASGATTNDNVIARVADNNAITVTSSGDVSVLSATPTDSGPTRITVAAPSQDTLTVTGNSLAPATANKGTTVRMERLAMSVSGTLDNSVSWNQLRVTRTGQSANADVDNVVVCLDDGNGTWDGIGRLDDDVAGGQHGAGGGNVADGDECGVPAVLLRPVPDRVRGDDERQRDCADRGQQCDHGDEFGGRLGALRHADRFGADEDHRSGRAAGYQWEVLNKLESLDHQ